MVWYCDTRRLGKIGWYADAEQAAAAFASSHGPDALEISREELAKRLSRTARGIKPALMDQKVLAGIGNIYADEVLHHGQDSSRAGGRFADLARDRPVAPGDRRDLDDRDRRWRARASTRAIEPYWGLKGASWPRTRSTARESQPCRRCSRPITKTRIAGLIGRPTYFCPHCQLRA